MATRRRVVEEGRRRGERTQRELGNELRDARERLGLSQVDVAKALDVSRWVVATNEGGERSAGIVLLSQQAAVVGLDLRLKTYANGSGLRDEGQVRLLDRFLAQIGDRWHVSLEEPVGPPGDPRAFDAVLRCGACCIAVEAITRLRDFQGQLRPIIAKLHASGCNRLIVVIGETAANRDALRAAGQLLANTLPLGTRPVLASLRAGRDPGANGLVRVSYISANG